MIAFEHLLESANLRASAPHERDPWTSAFRWRCEVVRGWVGAQIPIYGGTSIQYSVSILLYQGAWREAGLEAAAALMVAGVGSVRETVDGPP